MDAAVRAADRGLTRQTWVLDACTRLRVDARTGRARKVVRNEAALARMMGNKDRFLRPDRSFELLSALEILRPDGTLDVRSARKYKQVEHFVGICRPLLSAAARRAARQGRPARVVDLACGTGHLALALAEAAHLDGLDVDVVGVERDPAKVAAANEKAAMLEGRRIRFVAGTIEGAGGIGDLTGPVDVVVALHACDTATCDALVFGAVRGAGAILLAPCCQAELRPQLTKAAMPVSALGRGLLAVEYAAILTDALRVEILDALGYDTTTVSFTHGEHTAKHLLVRAVTDRPPDAAEIPARLANVRARADTLGLSLRALDRLAALDPSHGPR
ncbi:MAG: methyltransferase [Deltaproteobacteria bacterium]|nr:MAG: methyltransferase [Deltaproteobacteria bacterium]